MINHLLDNYFYEVESEKKILDLSNNEIERSNVYFWRKGHGSSLGMYLYNFRVFKKNSKLISKKEFLDWAYSQSALSQVAEYIRMQTPKLSTYLFAAPELKVRIKNNRLEKNIDQLIKLSKELLIYNQGVLKISNLIFHLNSEVVWTDSPNLEKYASCYHVVNDLLNLKEYFEEKGGNQDLKKIKACFLSMVLKYKFPIEAPELCPEEIEIFHKMIQMKDFNNILKCWDQITKNHSELK